METSWTQVPLKRAAEKGLIILAARRLVYQVIQSLSTILLARILVPQAFGAFAVLVFIVEFLGSLLSQGSSTAIIQKKEKLKQSEISTIFWVVTIFSVLVFIFLWFFAPYVNNFYKGEIENPNFLRLVALAVIAINLRNIPASLLERDLKYLPLAAVEIAEIVITQAVAITLALSGWGVKSLIYGYLSGKLLGVLLFFFFFRIPVTKFSLKGLSKFFSFAFNYQVYFLTYSISGAVAPIYVGATLGSKSVGYLTWAGSVGLLPWSIAELIGRVVLPVFSRAQKDRRLFARVLERAFDFLAMVTFPLCILIFVFADDLTVIVYSRKWLPAVGALRLFAILGLLQSSVFLYTTVLLGLGYVKFVRNITLFSGAAFWIFALILIPKLGFWAQPLAWILSTAFLLLTVFKVKKVIKVNYWRSLLVYLLLSMTAVISVYFLVAVTGPFSLFVAVLSSLLVYIGLLFAFRRENLKFVWDQCVSVLINQKI